MCSDLELCRLWDLPALCLGIHMSAAAGENCFPLGLQLPVCLAVKNNGQGSPGWGYSHPMDCLLYGQPPHNYLASCQSI